MENSEFVLAFKGREVDGKTIKGIRDIFTTGHVDCMKTKTVPTDTPVTDRLRLNDYVNVCQFSKRIKAVIEGYGFVEDGDYDNELFIKEEGTWKRGPLYREFVNYVSERHVDINKRDARFDKWVDPSKIVDRNFRMPKGGPLRHHEIEVFNAWMEAGMPEELDGAKYDPTEHGEVYPAPLRSRLKR